MAPPLHRPEVDQPDEPDEERSGPVETDYGNAVLANDAAVQNTFAVTGLAGFLLIPLAAGLAAAWRWLRTRVAR